MAFGVEQEFELYDETGARLDARNLIRSLLAGVEHCSFRGLDEAGLVGAGYVISADERDMELSTAPVLSSEGAAACASEVVRVRADLLGRLHGVGVDSVRGYSTHISISTDRPGALVWPFALAVAPALVALIDGPGSPGLVVRGRRGRLEITGEYLDDPDDIAAAVLLASVGVTLLERNPSNVPLCAVREWEPGVQRGGIYLPPAAFGDDLHARGREARVDAAHGGTVTVQELLDWWLAQTQATLGGDDDAATAIAMLDDRVNRRTRLAIERPRDAVPTVAVPVVDRNSSPVAMARAFGRLVPTASETMAPTFVDWDAICFGRGPVVAADRPSLTGLLAERESGRLASRLASTATNGITLASVDQVSGTADFAALDITALSADAEGQKPSSDRPPPPDKRPCAVTLSVDPLCVGEVGSAVAVPSDPGRLAFAVVSGAVRITSVSGTVATIIGDGPGPAVIKVTLTRADGCVASAQAGVDVRGVVLVPEHVTGDRPVRRSPVALWSGAAWAQVDDAPDLAPLAVGPSATPERGRKFRYTAAVRGRVNAGVEAVSLRVGEVETIAGITGDRFDGLVELDGLGPHRVDVVASDMLGVTTEVRAVLTVTPSMATPTGGHASGQRGDATRAALRDLKANVSVDEIRPRSARVHTALERAYELADRQEESAMDLAERTATISTRVENAELPTEPTVYRLVGYGPGGAPATITTGATTVGVDMGPDPNVRGRLISVSPPRFAFVPGLGSATTIGDVVVIPTQVAGDIAVEFDSCTDRLPPLTISVAEKASAWGVAGLEAQAADDATIDYEAVVEPAQFEGDDVQLAWTLAVRPPGATVDAIHGVGLTATLTAATPGRYVVQARAFFGAEIGAGAHDRAPGHVIGASTELVVDGAATLNGEAVIESIHRDGATAQAKLAFTTDRLDDRPPIADMRSTWTWTATNMASTTLASNAVGPISSTMGFTFLTTSRPSLRADLDSLELGEHTIPTPNLGAEAGPMRVVAGPTAKLVIHGSRDGGASWHEVPALPLSSGPYPPAGAPTALPPELRPTLGNGRTLLLRATATDDADLPVVDGTPVAWGLAGAAALEPPDGRVSDVTRGGEAFNAIRSQLAPARQLLMVSADEVGLYFGNPLYTVVGTFSAAVAPTSPAGTTASAQLLSFDERAQVTFAPRYRLTSGRTTWNGKLPAGTEVLVTVAPGSVWDPERRHFAPEATYRVGADGDIRMRVSPKTYASDGTRNWLRPDAFGEVIITAKMSGHAVTSVGNVAGASTFWWSPWPSPVRPRVILPHSGQIRQSDLRWVPSPSNTLRDVSTAAADRLWTVEGTRDETAIVDLDEHRDFEPFATFAPWRVRGTVLASRAGYGVGSAPRLTASGGPLTGAAFTTRASGTGDPTGGIVVMPWSVRTTTLTSEPMPDLSAFEVDFWIRPDGRLDPVLFPWNPRYDQFVLMTGGGADRRFGQWTIGLDYTTTPVTWKFRYVAHGCADRPQVDVTSSIAGPTTGWVHVIASVRGDPGRPAPGWVDVKLTVAGATKTTRSPNFNWIPGPSQTFELLGSTRNDYELAGLEVRREMNANFNFVADPGGPGVPETLTPTLVRKLTRVGPGSLGELQLVARRRPGAQPTSFSEPFETFASFVAGYCDDGRSLTRVDIAALDTIALNMQNRAIRALAGFFTGEGSGAAGFVGEIVAGFTGVADVRDIGKNLAYCVPGGEDPNWLDFTLAVLGLVSTAATVVTSGSASPANAAIAVLRPALKHLDEVGDLAPKLAPVVDDFGRILADEAATMLKASKRIGAAADVASIALVVPEVLSALADFYMTDPVIKTRADRLLELAEKYDRATLPTGVTPQMLPLGAFQFVAFAIVNRDAVTGAAQDLNDIAEAVIAKTTSLLALLNTAGQNIADWLRLLKRLTAMDVPAGTVGQYREQMLEIARRHSAPNPPTVPPRAPWEELPELAAFHNPNQWTSALRQLDEMAEKLGYPNMRVSYDTMRALTGFNQLMAGGRISSGLTPVGKLVEQIGLQRSDFLPERLPIVAEHLNSVLACAAFRPGPNVIGNTPESIAKFLRPLISGRTLTSIVDRSVPGTLWEAHLGHDFFRAGADRVILSPPRADGKLGADLQLHLSRETAGLPPGIWTGEAKAVYPDSRFTDLTPMSRQFENRIGHNIEGSLPLDFAYWFRGPFETVHADAVRKVVIELADSNGIKEADVFIRRSLGRFERDFTRAAPSPANDHRVRLFIEFAGIPRSSGLG